ncbi:hypothetical protein [Dyadobacter sp. 32]|uniref:hypothetical protein n=1 Tax=Dyadobacter sp. 32 TaxID=538966 RepID=UPI0011EC0C27
MDYSKILIRFFLRAHYDPKITTKHISIFSAILQLATDKQTSTLHVYSYELMEIAKVSCRKTYCKALTDLSRSGYLHYQPSFNHNRRSSITLLESANN